MNSLLSLHRAALELLTSARLPLANTPDAFLDDSFLVVVVRHPVLDPTGIMIVSVRGLLTGPARRSGHFPQGRLTCAHPVLSNRVVLLPRGQLIGSCMVRG
jgi:hypothetical protein